MKRWTWALCAASATALLASCGGGDGVATGNNTGFTQMVVFGDSLSDIGSYKVGSIAALGGGRWTVNSADAKNWTELIAAQYGLPTPCAAQTGLFPLIPGFAGAAIQNFSTCRNYAQGSSRVTSPAGPNSTAVQAAVSAGNGGGAAGAAAAAAAAPLGLMAIPIVTQMNNHLTAAAGSYGGKELVAVMAGGNDFFMNLNALANASAGGASAVGAAQLAGWTAAEQGAVAGGGAAAGAAGANAAVAGMTRAATELVGYIKTLVVAKGAKYIAVVNLPDVTQTPFGSSLDATSKAIGTSMITAFNSTLSAGLADAAGVIIVDAYTQGRDQIANPAQYGLLNITVPACSATSPANPLAGSSITCSPASTVVPDTSKYLFADTVHLTPFGYKLLAEYVTLRMITAGWR